MVHLTLGGHISVQPAVHQAGAGEGGVWHGVVVVGREVLTCHTVGDGEPYIGFIYSICGQRGGFS